MHEFGMNYLARKISRLYSQVSWSCVEKDLKYGDFEKMKLNLQGTLLITINLLSRLRKIEARLATDKKFSVKQTFENPLSENILSIEQAKQALADMDFFIQSLSDYIHSGHERGATHALIGIQKALTPYIDLIQK